MIILMKISLLIMLFIIIRRIIYIILGREKRKEIFNKINVSNTLENKQKNNSFILRMIFLTGMFILLKLNGHNIFTAFVVPLILLILIKNIRILKYKMYKKQVLQDLLNVSECLRVQISSQVPLDKALRSLSELCTNKEFAGLLTNIYLEYELSKFVIIDSANALQERFNYPEIRIFISALNQQMQGTSALEAFDNLINILKEKYIEFLEESTKNKMAILTMGVFIIVINIAAIGIYPVAVEVFNAMNTILK